MTAGAVKYPLDREAAYEYLAAVFEPEDIVQFDCFPKYKGAPEGRFYHAELPRRDINESVLRGLEAANQGPRWLNVYLRANPLRRVQSESATDFDIGTIRNLWLDVDGYTPAGLRQALAAGGWPAPHLLVASGGTGRADHAGCHAYFKLKHALTVTADAGGEAALAWVRGIVRALLVALHDDAGTANPSRLLRLPGSWNVKEPRQLEPQVCRIVAHEPENPCLTIDEWAEMLGVKFDPDARLREIPVARPAPGPGTPQRSGPQARWDLIEQRCAWAVHCRQNAATLPEPEWYAMLGLVAYCEGGRARAHELSRPYPGYNAAETDAKLDQWTSHANATKCAHVSGNLGHAATCQRCQHWGKIKSPIVLGYTGRRRPDEAAVQDTRAALVTRAKADPKTAISQVLGDHWAMQVLGWEHRRAPAAVEGLALQLTTECGVAEKDARALVRGVKEEAGRRQSPTRTRGGGDNDCEAIAELFPQAPAPPGLRMPPGYRLRPHGVEVWVHPQRQDPYLERVTSTPLIITGLLYDARADEYHARLAYRRRQAWYQLTVPRAALGDSQAIVKLLLSHCVDVTAANRAAVIAYLADYAAHNERTLPHCTAVDCLGWHATAAGPQFLLGSQTLRPRRAAAAAAESPREWTPDTLTLLPGSAGDEETMRAFHTRGTWDDWLKGIAPLEQFPLVQVGIYVALASVLLRPLGQPPLLAEFAGDSSTGKSIAQRIAASVCGRPVRIGEPGLVKPWSATIIGLIGTAAFQQSLPLIVEDTQTIGVANLPETQSAIYQLSQGSERARGDVDGRTRTTRSWQLAVLSSGEQRLPDLIQAAPGFHARVISVLGRPFARQDPATGRIAEAIDAAVAEHYGHALPRFVQYLLDHWGEREAWRAQHQALRDDYVARCVEQNVPANSPAYRLTAPLATLQMAADLAQHALGLPWDAPEMWGLLGPALLDSVEGANQARQAMELVIEHLSTHRDQYWSQGATGQQPQQGWLGRYDGAGHELVLITDVLRQIFDRHKLPLRRVIQQWYDRGWLQRDRSGGQPTRTIAGLTSRHYVVPADVLANFVTGVTLPEPPRARQGELDEGKRW